MNAPGCKCKDNCVNPETCACARRNGGDFPYVTKDGGRLETSVKRELIYFFDKM